MRLYSYVIFKTLLHSKPVIITKTIPLTLLLENPQFILGIMQHIIQNDVLL
jgi:hypothetical protein